MSRCLVPLATALVRRRGVWMQQRHLPERKCDSSISFNSFTRTFSAQVANVDDPEDATAAAAAAATATMLPCERMAANAASKHPSYFEVFGISPPQFNLSLDDLQQRYKKLMIEFHPDKHQRSSVEHRQMTEDKSALITRAYETLRHPQSRALYLLEELGHPMIEEATASHLLDHDFLMEVVEVREQMDEIEGDAQLKPLWESNQGRIQRLTQQLAEVFDQKPPNLEAAIRLTAKLQYWYRVEEKLLEQMEEIPESRWV